VLLVFDDQHSLWRGAPQEGAAGSSSVKVLPWPGPALCA
jgi:hypothetical protein